MACSRGRGRALAAPAASSAPASLRLFDLPTMVLEAILLLLPLKLRYRFSTTCRTARQLVCGSPCPQVFVMTHSRTQSLALLRWLGAACRGSPQLFLSLVAQRVPFIRQLQLGISMQAACVEELVIGVHDAHLDLRGSWWLSLTRLRVLVICSSGVVLSSSCGQLPNLQDLIVTCGCEMPGSHSTDSCMVQFWGRSTTFSVEPGAIPPSLTSLTCQYCSFSQLPTDLCTATGLKQLQLVSCAVDWGGDERQSPQLEPMLSCLTALETLQLQWLRLEGQDLAAQLLPLTGLQHLDLGYSSVSRGQEHALTAGFTQLSSLTSLRLAGVIWAGTLQPAAGSLPTLHELRLVVPPDCNDPRLPLLAAASRLQGLVVSAASLLYKHNLDLLSELPALRNIAIMVPPDDSFREQLEAGWAPRLVDRLHCLPALRCVVVVFPNDAVMNDPDIDCLWSCLETSRLLFKPILSSQMSLLPRLWVR